MKKRLLITTLMFILIMGLISITVNAANYSMNLASKIVDNTVTVTLSVTNFGEGIDAIQGTLKYDTDKLEFIEMKRANSKWQEPNYAPSTNKFTMLISGESFKENSSVFTINFKLKENITGKVNIGLSDLVLANINDEKINIPDVSTYVSIDSNKPDNNKNEIVVNTITNEVISNTTNTVSNTITNTLNNSIKDNTQATNKIPQTGENNSIMYIGITICSFIVLSIVIYIIRYKVLSK